VDLMSEPSVVLVDDGYVTSKLSLWKGYANSSLTVTVTLSLLALREAEHCSVLSDELNPAVNENARMDNTYTSNTIITHVVSYNHNEIVTFRRMFCGLL